MKDDISKELIEIGKKRPNPNLPQDLYVAIDTFMQQTIIIGQHELEYMPPEYMENLIRAVAKYPEYRSRPSASACRFTAWEPGTTSIRTPAATFLPERTEAASRRSLILELVQLPTKATSIL